MEVVEDASLQSSVSRRRRLANIIIERLEKDPGTKVDPSGSESR